MSSSVSSGISYTRDIFVSIGEQVKDSDQLYNLSQFGKYILKAAQYNNSAIGLRMGTFFSVVDVFEIPTAVKHFVGGNAKFDNLSGAMAAVAVAASAGTAEWLGDLGIIRKVTVVDLGQVACSAVAVAFIFMANMAYQDYLNADSEVKLNEAKMHVISAVANAALYTLLAMPGANMTAVIVVGFTAKGVDFARYVYKAQHPQEFKKG